MRYPKSIFFFLLMVLPWGAWSQVDNVPEYGKQYIYGINKSSHSGLIGGLVYRFSWALSPRTYHTIAVEALNIKHPRENRVQSGVTGNLFIPGKTNYLYAIRTTYGRDWLLFKKAPQQGVQINGIATAGPVFGLLAPYYVQTGPANGQRVNEPYDPNKHQISEIYGSGGLFQGLPESSVNIGLSAKVGLSFEFGTYKSNLAGFETGFAIDAFTKQMEIMPFAKNRAVFPSAYLNLFWGSRR
ncbi:hypothetical protein QWY31_12095 [Cytophagales bacterium LB-30]|uniref:Outer membrane protein beta-barrel domain-containing protein n=1 Tax=Shiella aurantiaca TaxID=3058365 RepID=A0ABT8F736_9BACT|nr:hypothetical protein [Shiella aurantiaca]MDN4166247.1 hypothetical protein [Shiella aurantiaca]